MLSLLLLASTLWSAGAITASPTPTSSPYPGGYTNCIDCTGPYYWCGGPSGVNGQKCVSYSDTFSCYSSSCVASSPSSCSISGSTACRGTTSPTPSQTPAAGAGPPPGSTGVTAAQGLGVKDAQTSFGAGLGVTFVMAVMAIVAVALVVARVSSPTVMAPPGTNSSVEQQKAIRSWKLAVVGSSCLFFSSFLGFAAPAVPWIAFSFGVNSSNQWSFFGIPTGAYGEATVIISTATASAKVCVGPACNTYTVPNPYFIPGAALMLLGAIFQLVAAIQLAYIATHLRRLSQTGAPAPAGCCCHNPAVQGFGWSGWVFGGIGAAWAGSAFAIVQAAVSAVTSNSLTLDPAPGGVMEAFVVLVGLVGCIIAAVLNCNITGVTGVGQSTTNCCCAQEAKPDFASGAASSSSGVTVVMTSPLQQQQQPMPQPHWITPPMPNQQFMPYPPGTPTNGGYPIPTATYSLPPPPTGEMQIQQPTATTTTITFV